MKSELILSGGTSIQLYKDEPINQVISIAPVQDLRSRRAPYTKPYNVPATKENVEFFKRIFEISAENTFNPNKKVDSNLLSNTINVMPGYVQLTDINLDLSNEIVNFVLTCYGYNFDFFKELEKNYLVDLDWSDFQHEKNQTNIEASWYHTSGYTYGLVDIGMGWQYGQPIPMTDLKPQFFVKTITDKIFNFLGLTYSSTIFNSDLFKHCVWTPPYISEKLEADVEMVFDIVFPTNFFTWDGYAKLISKNPITGAETIITEQYFQKPSTTGGATTTINIARRIRTQLTAKDQLFCRIEITPPVLQNQTFTQFYVVLASTSTAFGGFRVKYIDPLVEGSFSASTAGHNNYLVANTSFNNINMVKFNLENADPYNSYDNSTYIHTVPDATIANYIPSNYKMSEFILMLQKTFNLYFDTDKSDGSGKKMIVDTRDDYYNRAIGQQVKDWTKKRDKSRPSNIKLIPELQAKNIVLKFSDDNDYLNNRYKEDTNQTYGSKTISVDNDFLTSTLEIVPNNIAPSPLQELNGSKEIFLTRIYDLDESYQYQENKEFVPRLLYYPHGPINLTDETFKVDYGDGLIVSYGFYPYVGELNHPYHPSFALNFGTPRELFYTNTPIIVSGYPTQNLYTNFYEKYITELTDPKSKLITSYYNLHQGDIHQLNLFDIIFDDGFYYNVNKIDYDSVSDTTTKVELMVLNQHTPIVNSEGIIVARSIARPRIRERENEYGNYSDIVGDRNNMGNARYTSVSGYKNSGGNNNSNININGNNNFTNADNVNIFGSYNSAYTPNATIINGSGNTIWSGINVTMIGVNNYSGTPQSNTTYIQNLNVLSSITLNGVTFTGFSFSMSGSSTGATIYVQPGLNTYTGGTAFLPTVNISAFTGGQIISSGNSRFSNLSATTFSASTMYSGSTPLGIVFSGSNLWKTGTGVKSIIQNNNSGNLAASSYSFVAGKNNQIHSGSPYSSIIGTNSQVGPASNGSSIFGGFSNVVVSNSSTATIVGGSANAISSSYYGGIFQGYHSHIYNSAKATILAANYSVMNYAAGSLMLGGTYNKVYSNTSTVIGGNSNYIYSYSNGSLIIGGSANRIQANVNYGCIINGIGVSLWKPFTTVIGGFTRLTNFYSFSGASQRLLFTDAAGYVNRTSSGVVTQIAGGIKIDQLSATTFSATTVNVNTISANTISGASIYSGSTNLNDVFATLTKPYDISQYRVRGSGTTIGERWYSPFHDSNIGGSTTNLNAAINTLYLVPFIVPSTITLDKVAVKVLGGATNGKVRFGIYNASNVCPTTLVADFGSFTCTGAIIASANTSTVLSGGMFFMAINTTGATSLSLLALGSNTIPPFFGVANDMTSPGNYLTISSTFGALPSNLTTSAMTMASFANAPLVNFRLAP